MKSPLTLTPLFLILLPLSHAYTPLSDDSLLHHIPPTNPNPSSADPDFSPLDSTLLSPFLIPRVPGTPGHSLVQQHLTTFIRTHLHPSWTLEWHNTTSTTPATGPDVHVPFANLILRRDPPWTTTTKTDTTQKRGDVARLTLAAHYYSLYRPEGFVGAVDSAVPCAVLMFVTRAVDEALTRRWEGMVRDSEGLEDLEAEKGVQIMWFEVEDAWVEWSDADSLYGSR
jgi:hypothetical protein